MRMREGKEGEVETFLRQIQDAEKLKRGKLSCENSMSTFNCLVYLQQSLYTLIPPYRQRPLPREVPLQAYIRV